MCCEHHELKYKKFTYLDRKTLRTYHARDCFELGAM